MSQTLALIATILVGFSYGLDRAEREGSAYKLCSVQRDGRVQGNIRAEHQKKLEAAIIESNENAQNEIPGYHYPSSVTALKNDKQQVEILPTIKC